MIRIRKLVRRDCFQYLVSDLNISRIEINPSRNKGLRNPGIMEVYIYVATESVGGNRSTDPIYGIFGSIKAFNDRNPKGPYHRFTTGIMSLRSHGWLSATQVSKLMKIEEETGETFNIPKRFHELIKKYS